LLEAAGAGVRPLTTLGIADAAIEHVREDPVLYYGISAPVGIPLVAAFVYFADLVSDFRGDASGYAPRAELAGFAIALLLHLRLIAQGALAWALERKLRGVEVTIGGAWLAAAKRAHALGLAGVVFWAAILLGTLLAFLPAIVAFPLFVLGPAVAVIEERDAIATVFRSVELGWRETGRALELAVVLGLGVLFATAGVALGASGLLDLGRLLFYVDTTYLDAFLGWKNPLFRLGVLGAAVVLTEPVVTLAFALLYVDRRVRTEGFDLRRKVQLIVESEEKVLRERAAAEEVARDLDRDPAEGEPASVSEGVGS
jgi:hypothetical protein